MTELPYDRRGTPMNAAGSVVTPNKSTTPIITCGDIVKVEASLIAPFHSLLAAAADNMLGPDQDGMRTVASRATTRLSRATRGTVLKIQRIALDKHARPGVVCERPSWAKSNSHSHWVFPLGTFGGADVDRFPSFVRSFIRHIADVGPGDSTERSLHTTPEWSLTAAKRRSRQHLVCIPSSIPTAPTERWRSHRLDARGFDIGYRLKEADMDEIAEFGESAVVRYLAETKADIEYYRATFTDVEAVAEASKKAAAERSGRDVISIRSFAISYAPTSPKIFSPARGPPSMRQLARGERYAFSNAYARSPIFANA